LLKKDGHLFTPGGSNFKRWLAENRKGVSGMREMQSRDAMARRFVALVFVTFFAVGLAFGANGQGMRFQVPYEFKFGSNVLPAGTYTFSVDRGWLAVESANGAVIRQNIVTRLSGPAELIRSGYLIFDNAENGRILSEVWTPGTDGILVHPVPKGHGRLALSGADLDATRAYSGEAAYKLTCAKCHGEKGKGDASADKFFQLKIPRLNSDEVRAKSDAELTELITLGTKVMPPVEIDEAGFRHRLPPQD
jgi:mono/diheme cytochrome c family protein